MKTHFAPVPAQDLPVIAAMRSGALQQKGKFAGKLAREPFDAMKSAVPVAPGVRFEQDTLGGVPGWWCRPANARTDAQILYLHGGAYVLGSAEGFRGLASHFAALTRMDTFVADYRLAPEYPFPAAVDDVLAVYRGMRATHHGAIGVVGDSAGGALALGLLATLVAGDSAASSRPFAAAVMSPWTDLALGGDSMRDRAAADPIFTRDVMAAFAGEYLQGQDPMDPRASPLHGNFAGLPPVRIDVGDDEILLDDATRYAARAHAAGVDVTLTVWDGMPHSFQAAIGRLEAARMAVTAAAAFLVEKLDARA